MKAKVAFKSQEGKTEVYKFYDGLLEHWTEPNEKSYVETRYGTAFVIACGDAEAPPLVLLHGSAMNSVMWLSDAREYSRSFRVYAVDLPGEPGRSDERQLPFRDPAYAEWLGDVFTALAIEKASLVGISLGAWLSIKFAAAYPEKVDRLVLLCPAGIGRQKLTFALKAMVHMLLGKRILKKLNREVNGEQALPEVVLKYQQLIGENFNFRREIIPLFSDNEIKRLTMPTALFVGEKDVMLHSEMTARRLSRLLPHASINMIPGAGHVLVNLSDNISAFLGSSARV